MFIPVKNLVVFAFGIPLFGSFLAWYLLRFGLPEQVPMMIREFSPELFLIIGVVLASLLFLSFRRFLRAQKKILQTVQDLRLENEFCSLLADTLGGTWDMDTTSGKITFSKKWKEIFGYTEKDVPASGDVWKELIHPEDLPIVQKEMEMYLNRSQPAYEVEYRLRTKNERYAWVFDRAQAVWDESGKPIRLIGVTTDIGNMKRVEEVLKSRTHQLEEANSRIKQEKARTVALLESIGEGMLALDPDGRVISANPAAAELLRIPFEKLQGAFFDKLILRQENRKGEVLQESEWCVSRTLETGLKCTGSFYLCRTDETKFPVAFTSAPIILEGKLFGAIAVFRDITKEMDIDQAKTEFVSLASHQLRTPLSAIRWYSELVMGEKIGELNPKQKEYVTEVYESSIRMIELINALLNVSRIELGTFAIDPEPIDLAEVSNTLMKELTPKIREKGLSVTANLDRCPKVFMADKNLMRIVLQNLLSNAVKYTPEGGKVSLFIGESGGKLHIEVADTGYGIPKEQHDKIFSKLFRADNIRSMVTEGTGLGLYIIKSIVEKTGGKIWFESEKDAGTTFFIDLPLTGMNAVDGAKGLV